MKVGVKIGPKSPKGYIEKIHPFVDFIEVGAREKFCPTTLSKIEKPIVIHMAHFEDGVNLSNPRREQKNIKMLEWAVHLADKFESNKIIFHPDLKEDKFCSTDHLIRFLKKHYDKRLLVESMPFSTDGIRHLGASFEELEKIVSFSGVGFCLDLAHSSEYAKISKKNIKKYLNKLLLLNPSHFHLSDNKIIGKECDEYHLSLFEGTLDLELIKKLIPKGSWVTLETPQILEKQIKEIEFLKSSL